MKQKINIGIGVATGLLVGFVFGACLGSPDSSLKTTDGQASGNASLLSIHKLQKSGFEKFNKNEVQATDTLKFTMTDEKGNTWNVTMNK